MADDYYELKKQFDEIKAKNFARDTTDLRQRIAELEAERDRLKFSYDRLKQESGDTWAVWREEKKQLEAERDSYREAVVFYAAGGIDGGKRMDALGIEWRYPLEGVRLRQAQSLIPPEPYLEGEEPPAERVR